MSQKEANKFGNIFLVLSYVTRNFKVIGVVLTIINELFLFYLVYFFIGVAFALGLNWQIIILFILAFLVTMMTEPLSYEFSIFSAYEQVKEYISKFNHCQFDPIPIEEYVALLKPKNETIENNDYLTSKLSDSDFFLGKHTRIVVVNCEDSQKIVPGVTVAYYSEAGSWLFLKNYPDEMEGFESFTVLHEFGHTEGYGNISAKYKRTNLKFFIIITLATVLIEWTFSSFIIYVILFLLMVGNCLRDKWMQKYIRFYEEVYADGFAFFRANKDWFSDFSANRIAEIYCNVTNSNYSSSPAKFDTPMSQEQIRARKTIFANNIKRLRENKTISIDDFLGLIPYRKRNFFNTILDIAFSITLFFLGLQLTTISSLQLFIFISLSVFLIIFLSVFTLVPKYLATKIDYEIGYREKDKLNTNIEKVFDTFYKVIVLYLKIETKIQKKVSSLISKSL